MAQEQILYSNNIIGLQHTRKCEFKQAEEAFTAGLNVLASNLGISYCLKLQDIDIEILRHRAHLYAKWNQLGI